MTTENTKYVSSAEAEEDAPATNSKQTVQTDSALKVGADTLNNLNQNNNNHQANMDNNILMNGSVVDVNVSNLNQSKSEAMVTTENTQATSPEETQMKEERLLTVSNGEMKTNANLPQSHNAGYADGVSFKYGFILSDSEDTEEEKDWHPITGRRIEYWHIPSENRRCVELRANAYSHGIKQRLLFYKTKEVVENTMEFAEGFYLLTWQDRARLDDQINQGDTADSIPDAYEVLVSVGDPSSTHTKIESLSIKENEIIPGTWKNRAMVIRIKREHEFNTEQQDIWLSFKNTNSSTFGSLISNVSISSIRLYDEFDDSLIVPYDEKPQDENQNMNSIAWIHAHHDSVDVSPQMPELVLYLSKTSEGSAVGGAVFRLQAKLKVFYNRPGIIYNSQPVPAGNSEILAKDTVLVPDEKLLNGENYVPTEYSSDKEWYILSDHHWRVSQDVCWWTHVNQDGFFGGDATLSFKVYKTENGTETQIGDVYDYKFRIAGQNPVDNLCENYIIDYVNTHYSVKKTSAHYKSLDSLHEKLSDMVWCIPAIAKHESYGYSYEVASYRPYVLKNNSMQTVFNQFECKKDADKIGIPLHRRYETKGAGGFGMYQVTGTPYSIYDAVCRGVIWNWQINIHAAMEILLDKMNEVDIYFTSQLSQQEEYDKDLAADKKHPLVDYRLINSIPRQGGKGTTYDFTIGQEHDKRMVHLCALKAYNGASRTSMNSAPEIVNANPQYRFDSNLSGHYCSWIPGTTGSNDKPWVISNLSGSASNYVDFIAAMVNYTVPQ